MSVCMNQFGSQWTDFQEVWHLSNFPKSIEIIQVLLESDKNNGYFAWRPIYIFYHISLISSYKKKRFRLKVVEKIKTRILCSITFFFLESLACYEIMWKNSVELDTTDDNIIMLMRFACWVPKAANTRLKYVILIDFPLQQLLHERASMLPYKYIASLSKIKINLCCRPM